MKEGFYNGKRYIQLTEEEIKQLPPDTRIYHISEDIKAIPPADCEHEYIVNRGVASNIKSCKKCIWWEFTKEPPTDSLY